MGLVRFFPFYSIAVLMVLVSCSPQRMVIRQMEPVLNGSVEALYEESDLTLAEQALASNLKLIEGLLKSDPQNKQLLLLAAQGYAGYAQGFVEDTEPERAKALYLRSRDYALEQLRRNEAFREAQEGSIEEWRKALNKMEQDDVPELFWTGFAWAGYINLSIGEPGALINLPKVELIMKRVEQLQPTYFNGAVYLFLGSVYGMKPRLMGGDPDIAKEYFEKNLKITEGKFLMTHVYMARYYAAKTLDENAFDRYLKHVEEASLEILPEVRLLNAIAKKKAALLKKQKSELF